jgi:drug/metabolite transporter (DMT)-like permease
VRKYAVLAIAQIAVGAAAIFARLALSGASPLAVAAARLVLASLVLAFIAAIRRDASTSKRDMGILLAAGLALALHFAGWIWSLEYTSVAVSTLLVATTPIWTAIYDSAVRKRRLSIPAWAALAFGMAGLVMIVGFNRARPPIAGHELLGDALALTGAFAIGAYFMLVREVRSAYGTRTIVTRTYTWAAIVLVIGAAAARQAPPSLNDGVAWGGILAMAFVSQLMGHTALNSALRWFSPSAVAFTSLLEPVFAAVLAYIIFGEALTPVALGGAVLLLGAIGVFLREESGLESERSSAGIGAVQ